MVISGVNRTIMTRPSVPVFVLLQGTSRWSDRGAGEGSSLCGCLCL